MNDFPGTETELDAGPGFLGRTAVVMPALDEEASVGSAVRHWVGWEVAEVRVADNGSRDTTADRAREAGARVVGEPRRGYGAAAWAGARSLSEGIDWILFASADGSDFLDEESAAAFDGAVKAGAGLVVGERVTRPDARRNLTPAQRFGNALCCGLIALGWRAPRFRDMGSLRLIRRDVFEALALRDRAFGWNIEMQVAAIERGVAIAEVPVGYRPRTAGQPKISGSLAGVFRAGRGILGTLAKLWWRKRARAGLFVPATGRRGTVRE
ncbi:MAG: glycosyltransferase [Verrucomicrobiales bacterium]